MALKTFRVEWLDIEGAVVSSFTVLRERLVDCLSVGVQLVSFDPAVAERVVEIRIHEISPEG